jgi:hypothetical protein
VTGLGRETRLGQASAQPQPHDDLSLHNVLDIERSPTELLVWLREPDRLKRKQNTDVLVLRSGREIDCSGDFFQDLIQNGSIAEKFCSKTPEGASRSTGVPLEKEWFKEKRIQSRIPIDTRLAVRESSSGSTPRPHVIKKLQRIKHLESRI